MTRVEVQERNMVIQYVICPHCGETLEDLDVNIKSAFECPNCNGEIETEDNPY